MKLKAQMVILSHLSDAEHLVSMGCEERACLHINFAKTIILNSERMDTVYSVEELNEMWSSLVKAEEKKILEREAIRQILIDAEKEMEN